MRTIIIAIVLMLSACGVSLSDPTTFPERICSSPTGSPQKCGPDNRSPARAGVSCQAMAHDEFGCTEWDGHHTLTVLIAGKEVTLSDLGESWWQTGPWHEIDGSNDEPVEIEER